MCYFILENSKFCDIINSINDVTKNKLCHFILEKIKFFVNTNNIIYKYMTWFKRISVKEYDDLIKSKNKIYNITPNFTSPELMNKYRDDDDDIINKKNWNWWKNK